MAAQKRSTRLGLCALRLGHSRSVYQCLSSNHMSAQVPIKINTVRTVKPTVHL